MTGGDRLKILHVATHTGLYRGGAVQMTRMATAQRRRGHQVTAIVRADRSDSAEKRRADRESWRPLSYDGVKVQFVDYETKIGAAHLRRFLREGGYQIVHAHRDDALVAVWKALEGKREPALVAQRGTISRPPRAARRVFASERTRAVVAVARAVPEALAREIGEEAARKIDVVYGSVDTEAFRPRAADFELKKKLGLSVETRIIGSLSAFREAKGLGLVLKAVARVFETHADVHAVFLGRKVKKRMLGVAETLGIAERCHFVGHQVDVARWISIMDLTVVAATDREGLSGVLRESLAMGVPVISTDCAGNSEIVRDRESGLLVPMENAGALAEAIEWALAHPDEMKQMARRGREWVLANCSLDAQAEKLEAIYRSVLSG